MNSNSKLSTTLLVLIISTTSAFAAGETMKDAVSSPLFWVILVAVVLLLAVLYSLNKSINAIRDKMYAEDKIAAEKEGAAVKEPANTFMQALTDAVPVDQQEDILLDHNYDGIMELDNNLPPWWKYGFYLTIVWGVIYFIVYHVTDSKPLQVEEFKTEMAEAQAEVDAYIAATGGSVDESNVELLTDPSDIAAGKEIFSTTCFVCHAADGGGNSIGPNLTDEYWINGDGTISEIYKVVKYGGRDGRGMQSWSGDLSAKKMQQVSSYILSLKGTTTAAPKDAEGEHYP